ncbi:MAG: hypothetical protein Q7J44_12670, partial [Pseudotabrizicola sp.]|uniref:hypothetical protein n=1 Tax=Pseudotabrizicola sp. TaxID=2939647 RepID=UPI002719A3D6
FRTTNELVLPATVPSDVCAELPSPLRRFISAFPLVFRFGKAVFRPSAQKLQEEIFTSLSFFCATLYFLG